MTLDNYLEKNNYSQNFRDLIQVIVDQIQPIKDEFLGGDEKIGIYNVYGEEEVKLDKRANEILIEALQNSKLVKEVGSEEEEKVIEMNSERGHFGITLDPLDGSSLLSTNLAVGIIVSIYENGKIMSGLKNITESFYILLGPLTLMVFAGKEGVAEFAYNKKGIFDLNKEKIEIPEGNLYSPGGLRQKWTEVQKGLINKFEQGGFKLRYSGSFVPDFHQILVYGGIFIYPALVDKSDGKLRVLFEVGPMAFIAEKAGGMAIDGQQRILDIMPTKVDQRTPIYIGSRKVVTKAKEMLL